MGARQLGGVGFHLLTGKLTCVDWPQEVRTSFSFFTTKMESKSRKASSPGIQEVRTKGANSKDTGVPSHSPITAMALGSKWPEFHFLHLALGVPLTRLFVFSSFSVPPFLVVLHKVNQMNRNTIILVPKRGTCPT